MRTQSYNILWQKLHKAARNGSFPLRVMFELTYRCNFSCKHCYVPHGYRKNREELSTEAVCSILDQLRDIGCFYLGFTGGEPFMRKDILDILWYAKRCGFEIIIYTNGSLIDARAADELAKLNPNKVDITIPAMSADAFERISGLANSRDKVFKAIELLHKREVTLGFKSCLLKENETEIKEIQDFAASLEALHRLDDRLSARLDGSIEPYQFRGSLNSPKLPSLKKELGEDECDLSLIELDGKNSSTELLNTVLLFPCGVGVSQAAITPQGELKMCVMIDYPKYKMLHIEDGTEKVDLKTSWERLKKLVASIKVDENYQCNKCALKPYCKWCPAKGWLDSKSFTSCEAQSRRWAQMQRAQLSKLRQKRPVSKEKLTGK